MSRKYGTFSSELLIAIGEATGFFSWPLEYTEAWRRKQLRGYKNKQIYDSLHRFKTRGLVKEFSKNRAEEYKALFRKMFKKEYLRKSKILLQEGHSFAPQWYTIPHN